MLETRIIEKTLRVPEQDGQPGDGAGAARQLDGVLMQVGFKCSRDLLEYLSGLTPETVIDTGVRVLGAVRRLVGDHVQHNVCFRDFPYNVPDTHEFWLRCVMEALSDENVAKRVRRELRSGVLNLTGLPTYGRYQHTYGEMLAAHDELIPAVEDRITIVELGDSVEEQARQLYPELASSSVPLSESDLTLLGLVAELCAECDPPDSIPVRENRAIINRVRLGHDKPLLVDTVTDVLRLACALCDGDVSLRTPTAFRSFRRRDRRTMLAALDDVVRADPAKLADVSRHARRWAYLARGLHPEEYAERFPRAVDVFAVARGDKRVRSLAGRVEVAFTAGDIAGAASLMTASPGMLFRGLDRLLRAATADEVEDVVRAVASVADKVSGRVLLSVREHLLNRTEPGTYRVFVNRSGRAYATADDRKTLDAATLAQLTTVLDDEIALRLPAHPRLLVEPAVRDVAVPLSGKTIPEGIGLLPRGSVQQASGEILSFFIHWKENNRRSDYDLSVLLLDDEFTTTGQVSWTNLSGYGATHSGDITESGHGATEIIELDLTAVSARYIVPQVHVFSGEGFDESDESFFGFMRRDRKQKGQPYEPRTVRAKSELRGTSRTALPLIFARDDDGNWSAKWMHLFLRGKPCFNRVETSSVTARLLTRSIVEREYVSLGHLVDLMSRSAQNVEPYAGQAVRQPVTFIGLQRPEGLPPEATTITADRFNQLVPE